GDDAPPRAWSARSDCAHSAGSREAWAPGARGAARDAPRRALRPPSAPATAGRRRPGRPAWPAGRTAARWPRSRRGPGACARPDRSPAGCVDDQDVLGPRLEAEAQEIAGEIL